MHFNLRYILFWLMPLAAILGWTWSIDDAEIAILLTASYAFLFFYLRAFWVANSPTEFAKPSGADQPGDIQKAQRPR